MSLPSVHGIYAVKFDTTAIANTVIGGITAQSMDTGTRTAAQRADGQVHPYNRSISEQRPAATFTCLQLAKILAEVGQYGALIDAVAARTGITFYGYKHAEGGTREGASAHKSWTIEDGIIVPDRLTVSQGADGQIGYGVYAIAKGANKPVIPAENVSVPAVTDDERFTMGPVKVGNIDFTGWISLELAFNCVAAPRASDGDIYATLASLRTAEPIITLRGLDVNVFKTSGAIPLGGLPCTLANTILWLRQKEPYGGIYANNQAKHIKVCLNGLAHVPTPFDGAGDADLENTVLIEGVNDGANGAMTIAVDQVIP